MLSNAGMTLGKITANHPAIMDQIPRNAAETSNETNSIKALGIWYDVQTDHFSYRMKPPQEGTVTKLSVLSIVSSIYDPIG